MYEDHPHGLAVPGSRPVHQDPHRQRQWQNSRAWVPESVPTSSLQSFYTARSLYNTGAWPIPSSPSATRYPWSRQQPGLLVDTGLSKSPTSYISDDYYEVVLDDGTRQKRSVSLSTLPPTPGVKTSNDWRDTYFYHQGQRNGSADERTALLPSKNPMKYQTVSSDSSDTEVEDEQDSSPLKPSLWSRIQSRCQLDYKQKMVLKCSLAYMLGSLFTFVPYLNSKIGGSSVSSHVVATVTVWFNPAKSIGGMIEASGFGLLYAVAALFISLLSLATTTYLTIDRQMYLASCAVTLGVWLAGSTFVIAFFKAALDKPSIRTASSLAFIILFSVLVRETSTNKGFMDTTRIEQTFSIVLIGTAITIAVCFIVWPMRSTRKLKQDINATLSSLRVLLKLLVKTFLLDADLPDFTANKQLEEAIKAHGTSFTSLQKSLKEAKLEFFSMEMWRQADGYEKAVISLQRLAQHISGLRSSCGLEFEAINEYKATGGKTKRETVEKTTKVKAAHHRKKMENELKREHSMEQNLFNMEIPVMERQISSVSIGNHPHDLDTVPESPFEEDPPAVQEEIIEEEGALTQFIRSIRGPMKSLAYTCKQTITHLEAHFTGQVTSTTPTFELLKRNLAIALNIFEESEHRALLRFYRRKLKKESLQNLDVNQLHSHLMKQFPAEDVFLVYFFVFCMLEFAKELGRLVEHVQSIFEPLEEDDKSMLTRMKEMFRLIFRRPVEESEKIPKETFVPNNNNTIDTLQTPSPKTRIRKFFIRLWGFFSWFRQHTVRYAIKATLVSVALAVLAYIPATQQYFREYRMEWTLISIMAVMSPTVGGTNLVAVLRVLATILGCIVGALVYIVFPANPMMLLLCTWAFSIPCFWVILNHKYGRFGQFALLAYNLVVLYSYNHREERYLFDVVDLAWKRCIAVSLGVVIGLAVTAYIWPYEARKELRKGLSDFLLRLSWLYKQLVSVCCDTTAGGQNDYSIILEQVFYDTRREEPRPLSAQELEALTFHNKILAAQFQDIELALQVSLVSLRELLTHAPNEPRLKGPFPVKTYDAMLTCCQNILDKFLSMRIVILKDVWALQVRRAFMFPASKEWMDMAGNILLYFYLLASALQLKTPLPPYLPPAEQARQVLLKKLEQILPSAVTYTTTGGAPTAGDDEEDGYMVYYAYVAMMENIIQELDKLGGYMKDLYGTLVPADQWQRCFGLLDMERMDTRFLFNNDNPQQDYFGKNAAK